MKRALLVIAVCLLVSLSDAAAQISGGAITGTLRDEQGAVLTDTKVTVTGGDFTAESISDDTGRFRVLNLSPGRYRVAASRAGFNEFVHDNVDVRVGATSDLIVTMKLATIQEAITVGGGGQTPIVDTRTTGTATNFALDHLEKIPTSRDPFALLRSVPGVLVDRMNVGGNETGQQSNPVSKGTRPFDTTWTLDGIVVTDMVSAGASPIYYNHDNFEEIQVSTAGQDIRQQTGGLGVNLVVRHGTNDLHGLGRAYFTGDALEAGNLHDDFRATGVTAETADRTDRISDVGFDVGGPIVRDRLWFHGSYSQQHVKLLRAGAVDRTTIRNPNLKINWQATLNDRVTFLYFDGDRIREGRPPTAGAIVFHAPTALHNQHNAYGDNPFHGLWKVEDNRTFGSVIFASGKVAYFNTGFELEPAGGMDMTSGRSVRLGRSFGSVNLSRNVRPQVVAAVDAMAFRAGSGMSHDIKFGTSWRRVRAHTITRWPGNGLLALDNSPTDRRVRLFREGLGSNQIASASFYVGDTIQMTRLTVDVGIRFDHQSGAALPSRAAANPAFPALVPGVDFAGFDLPIAWNTWSPRAGFTYALTDNRRAIVRASINRFAGQMPMSVPALLNPSSSAGFREYRWNDANGDNLATADEVLLDQFITSGGGFSAVNPTAVTSAHQLSQNFEAPVTTTAVFGMDYELAPNLVVQSHYSYTRSENTIGNVLPRLGVSRSDYAPGAPVTGTLPEGLVYNIPTFIPDAAAVARSGGGVVVGNWPGYASSYHGLEFGVVKRLSARWMGRLSLALNNASEHYDAEGLFDAFGNPTRTDTEPLVDGGQYAPSPGTEVFLNAKWQFTAEGLYQLPQDLELSFSVFGRQGYPFPPFRQVPLGADVVRVLLTPEVDTFRLPNVWTTDLRIARPFAFNRATINVMADVFNLFNANTELVRNRNAGAANYRALVQTLSPRILRLGVRVGL